MSLEQHVARIFDDQEPTRFGSGWLSGTTSVFLGAIGLAAVACFHFPELLSSPDVRARLPMPFVRTTLQLVIGFANVSWRFPRVVEALIVTPRFHHWHHGAEAAALDKNFAVHLPWIDRLFGTYHCPQGQWPSEYGIAGNPVPEGYLAQLTYPLTADRATGPRLCTSAGCSMHACTGDTSSRWEATWKAIVAKEVHLPVYTHLGIQRPGTARAGDTLSVNSARVAAA